MTSGFEIWKDILDVVGIPVALAIFALAWPPIQSWYRCRRFKLLTGRELKEICPFPESAISGGCWTAHLRKSFFHQQILEEISDNRDFVPGLDPDFVYSVSQLWKSYTAGNADQWLWYLKKLASHRYLRKQKLDLLKIRDKWQNLIDSYEGCRLSLTLASQKGGNMTYEGLMQLVYSSTKDDWAFSDERRIYAFKQDLNIRMSQNMQWSNLF